MPSPGWIPLELCLNPTVTTYSTMLPCISSSTIKQCQQCLSSTLQSCPNTGNQSSASQRSKITIHESTGAYHSPGTMQAGRNSPGETHRETATPVRLYAEYMDLPGDDPRRCHTVDFGDGDQSWSTTGLDLPCGHDLPRLPSNRDRRPCSRPRPETTLHCTSGTNELEISKIPSRKHA
jgi:hypothetical protein